MKSEKKDEDIEAAAADELHRQKPRRGMEDLYDQILERHEEKKTSAREGGGREKVGSRKAGENKTGGSQRQAEEKRGPEATAGGG
ncbi:Hypothetical predicted protein [Xyrichtys novacula]|uniref:Uncharacterized protein n=1 Tax=Xyrichtys novacula TaxID=13765 RepID=A0AAV1GKF3_XYRNO|nr:Hypothetical predicted protein [Xyrichtys novacula]